MSYWGVAMAMVFGTKKSFKTALLAGAAILTALSAQPAFAQADEKVTVTGTRIKQPNNVNATSTQSINSLKIELSGEANVVDVLRDLPIVGVPAISSVNSNFATSGNGINTLDLRNLGTARTLVLVNGRRWISGSPLTQAVDFNSIPTEMIERVDVVSGGSSAVYGSDAIAGVVNIILRRDFEGLKFNVQMGGSEVYPTHDTYNATATAGANFADDKGNATISVGYSHAGEALARDRAGQEQDCLGGLFFGGSAFTQNCPFFSGFAEGGVFRFSTLAGAASQLRVIAPENPATIRARNANEGFNRQGQRLNFIPQDRFTFVGTLNYDFVPEHNVFMEVNFSNITNNSQIEPIPLDSDDIYGFTEQVGALQGQRYGIRPDNPFIPRAMLDNLGTRFGIVNPQLLARNVLVNQLMAIPGAAIGFQRRMTELGNRGQDFNSVSGRFLVGLEGVIGNWDYEAYYSYGRTSQSQVGAGGGVNVANMRNALDVVDNNIDGDNDPLTDPNNVVCRDPVAVAQGCIPLTPFFVPVATPAVWNQQLINYLRAPVLRDQVQVQEIIAASATGGLFDTWAGEVEAAVGAEYRLEKGSDTPDALSQTGQNGGNIAPPTAGMFDVFESYAEVKVPLVKDEFLIKEFNVHGAARWSDYSSLGVTFAWSGDAEWIITDGVRLRGQLARAVRAPNIGELFTGASETFGVVVDVCNNLDVTAADQAAPPYTNLNAAGPTNQTVIANCLLNPAIAARAAAGGGGFVLTQPELQGTGGFQQGNPGLTQETSDSQQFGFVITPAFWGDWFGNLTLSADYFVVDISNAIALVGRNNTIQLCYASVGLSSPFCNATPGGPVGLVRDVNGALVEVNSANGNINAIETSGFEVQVQHNFQIKDLFGLEETDLGRLQTSLTWQHLNNYLLTTLAGTAFATTQDFAKTVGTFENEVNLGAIWTIGDLTLSWSGQWMSEGNGLDNPGDLLPEEIKDQWFHDISGSYAITENLTVYGGVRNVANNYVFIGQSQFAATPTGWTTEPDTYDGIGRRFFGGVRVNF